MINEIPAGNVRLGDKVERKDGSLGVVRALAWIDEGIYVYYKKDAGPNAERFATAEKVHVLDAEREL